MAYLGKTAPGANAKIAPLISEKVFDPNSIPVGTFKHAVHITCFFKLSLYRYLKGVFLRVIYVKA